LNCGNTLSCERSRRDCLSDLDLDLSSFEPGQLTCLRALPGIRGARLGARNQMIGQRPLYRGLSRRGVRLGQAL
jgi:hypothetical protein